MRSIERSCRTQTDWLVRLGLIFALVGTQPGIAQDEAVPDEAAQVDAVEVDAVDAVDAVPALGVQIEVAPVLRAFPVIGNAEALVEIAGEAEGVDENAEIAGQDVVVFGKGDWKYLDTGKAPGENWVKPEFDDSTWKQGRGIVGYGDQDITTSVSWGDDPEEKHITTYLRRTFEVKDAKEVAGCGLRIIADDAAVVYLNGKEVVRKNIALDVPLTADTTSNTAVSGTDERRKWLFAVPADRLVEGQNQLAIELHQCNDTSSDLAFDLELKLLDQEQVAVFAARQERQRQVVEREAAAAAVEVEAAVVADAFILNGINNQPETQQYYFSDGEVTYHMADGRTITQRSDAVQQISQSFPYIRFARALGGDTVEKMAAQYSIDPVKLRLTNRLTPGSVFRENEVVCLRWRHRVMKDESLDSIAKLYNMDPTTLRRLNEFSDDAEVKDGQVVNVAGRYDHQLPQTQRGNQGHLMLTVVTSQMNNQANPIRNVGPMRQHAAEVGETFETVAKKYQVTPEFLRRLNCMSDDDDLQPGDIVLVNREVRPSKDSTIDDLLFASGIEIEDLLDVNEVQSIDQLDTAKGFQLPRPLQRSNQNTVVDFVDGGFF